MTKFQPLKRSDLVVSKNFPGTLFIVSDISCNYEDFGDKYQIVHLFGINTTTKTYDQVSYWNSGSLIKVNISQDLLSILGLNLRAFL